MERTMRIEVATMLEDCANQISQLTGQKAVVSVQYLRPETPEVQNKKLIEIVTNVCGVDWYQVTGRKRKIDFVIARHLYSYVARTEFGQTFKGIADTINRDHTSVIHSVNVVVDMLKTNDKMFTLPYDAIIERLNPKPVGSNNAEQSAN